MNIVVQNEMDVMVIELYHYSLCGLDQLFLLVVVSGQPLDDLILLLQRVLDVRHEAMVTMVMMA